MQNSELVQDILCDIEFELMQGTISQSDLRNAIQSVRQFQNTLRAETFQDSKASRVNRALVSRQFQVTDMLISVLMQMATTIQALEVERQRSRRALPAMPAPTAITSKGVEEQDPDDYDQRTGNDALDEKSQQDVRDAMRPESIHVDLAATPIRVPLIGWPITLVRIFLHRVALFYVHKFAKKQGPINRTYGDSILQLSLLVQQQQQELDHLREQIRTLEDHVAHLRSANPEALPQ